MAIPGEPVLLHEVLERSAERAPESPFLRFPDRIVTYGEAEDQANRFARCLRRLRIRRGDRIGILAENSLDYVLSYYGTLKAGAAAVPINTSLDARGLDFILDNCRVRALVTQPRFAEVTTPALARTPDLRHLITRDPGAFGAIPAHIEPIPLPAALEAESGASAPPCPAVDIDLASIIYTSGSTGQPRGAMLTHLNLVSNVRSIVTYLRLTSEDRILVILPFYYVYGKSLLNTHAWAGGSLIVGSDLLFPNSVVDRMKKDGATGISGVPSTFALLMNRSRLAADTPPSLRYITQAGGAMAPELIRRLMEALPGVTIYIMYGATEAGARLTYLPPADLPRKVGSIGRAIPNVEMRVLREDATEADVGETGELVARGSNIMAGYWGDLEETRRVLGPEGFHTGDLGRRDEEGFLYVVGRKREMIKCGAHRISPKEVEEVLMEHPEIHEAAVIGIPDEILGEAILAFVVLREGHSATEAALKDFASSRLPEYKIPAAFSIRAELPKNESGKIQKQKLKDDWNARA
ncbi:MAG: acyl--CoA ligase [Candidatus Eisenbacteria bacterium]|nr:acyl--CoA ligase [Candidatus Eisenbacteria bacterium]